MIEQLVQADRLLTVDMVEQAEAVYRRVAEADPNNAIAVVGLARCALARADDRRAWELAARALVIDPENDLARRMEARLAEILATRGEPVSRPAAARMAAADGLRPVVTESPAAARMAASEGLRPVVTEPPAAGAAGPPSTSAEAGGDPDPGAAAPRGRSLLDRLLGR